LLNADHADDGNHHVLAVVLVAAVAWAIAWALAIALAVVAGLPAAACFANRAIPVEIERDRRARGGERERMIELYLARRNLHGRALSCRRGDLRRTRGADCRRSEVDRGLRHMQPDLGVRRGRQGSNAEQVGR